MMGRLAQEILESATEARSEFLSALGSVPVHALRATPEGEPWSVFDILAHMPEVDYFYLQQALAARNEPRHEFRFFDDERWNNHGRVLAAGSTVEDMVGMLRASFQTVTQALSGLSDGELKRDTVHPRAIPYTVGDIFRRLPVHDGAHVRQIASIMAATSLNNE